MREAMLLIVLVAASATALAPSAGALVPGGCDAAATLSTDPLQDDGYGGRDAGETPADAVELPGHGSYWGLLDIAQRDGADLVDWFSLQVPYTRDEAKFSVGSNDSTGAPFLLEVFLPDESTPALTISQEDGEVPIPLSPPGLWHMRVTPIDPPAIPQACASGHGLVGPVGLSGTNTYVHNYGLYFGCDPLCAWSA